MSDLRRPATWDRHWRWAWVAIFIAGMVFASRTTGSQQSTPIEVSVLHRISIFVVLGVLLLLYIADRDELPLSRFTYVLLAFLLWQVSTTVWSVYPLWSLYRSAEYGVAVTLAVYTGTVLRDWADLEDLVTQVCLWYSFLSLTVWAGFVLFREQALIPSTGGPFGFLLMGVLPRLNPNRVTQVAAVVVLISLSRVLLQRDRRFLPLLALGALTMFFSQSRSSMLGFAAGVVVLFLAHRRLRLLLTTGSLTAGIVLLLPRLRDFVWNYATRNNRFGEVVQLGGRLHKWKFAVEYLVNDGLASFLVGFGAYAGARFVVMPKDPRKTNNIAGSTHSTWVDTLTDSGLFGVILLALVVAGIIYYLFTAVSRVEAGRPRRVTAEVTAVFAVVVVRSMFSRTLIVHNDFVFLLAVATVVFFLARSGAVDYYTPSTLLSGVTAELESEGLDR